MRSASKVWRMKKTGLKVSISRSRSSGRAGVRKKARRRAGKKNVLFKLKKRGWIKLRRRGKGKWKLRRLRRKGLRGRARALRRRKAGVAAQPAVVHPPEPQEEPGYRTGVNIVGFVRAEMGIGESSRLAARSLASVEFPFDIMNFPVTLIRMDDRTWEHKEVEHPEYKVNLYHMNADTMRSVHHYFGHGLFERRHNIGYWHWELPDFPNEFCDGFEFVQEVWAPSSFVVESIAQKSPVPVIRIPHGIEVHYPEHLGRGSFGLPDNRFLFFSMYDTHSYQLRKNPQGAIEAFKRAFEKNDPSVGLVVKLNHSHANPGDLDVLHQLIRGYNNIYIIDQIMSRGDVNALLNCTDSFISLHRAEGFGLGLAEAMYLGKPVIGTYWSGNTDFMNDTNSCPIGYSLTQVGTDWGPYKGYQTWAEPDLDHAAQSMREIRFNEAFRHSIAVNGQMTIRNDFSPQAVGNMMINRLRELGLA